MAGGKSLVTDHMFARSTDPGDIEHLKLVLQKNVKLLLFISINIAHVQFILHEIHIN